LIKEIKAHLFNVPFVPTIAISPKSNPLEFARYASLEILAKNTSRLFYNCPIMDI